jgi:hypothetical protein
MRICANEQVGVCAGGQKRVCAKKEVRASPAKKNLKNFFASNGHRKTQIALANGLQIKKELQTFVRNSLIFKSGYQDSNLGPPAPKAGALPDCATSRKFNFPAEYGIWQLLLIPSGMHYKSAKIPLQKRPAVLCGPCGWGGIRTRGTGLPVRRFSKPVVSATHPPIRTVLKKASANVGA